MVLNRRTLYMLPTPHGLVFTLALFAMLLIAVNYNNGLAYGFVFLVAGMAAVSMLFTHRNLAGLEISVADAEPVFAGSDAQFPVRLSNPQPFLRQSLWLLCGDFRTRADVPAAAIARLTLPAATQRRGYAQAPSFRLASAYPFGLLYTWSRAVRAESARVLVYPRPAGDAPLPRAAAWHFEAGTVRREGDDFIGLRDFQDGDSPRHVHWKALASTGRLVTKQFGGTESRELWLDWAETRGDLEARLSQLCQWVLQADRAGLVYGLRLPQAPLAPGAGPRHRHTALKALALWRNDDVAPV